MTILPAEFWDKLDDSLGQIDLRLSPEQARARIQRTLLLQQPGEEGEQLYISIAAMALAGALACRLREEAAARAANAAVGRNSAVPSIDAPADSR